MITALILSILFLWWFIWFCKTQDIKDAKEFEEKWKKEFPEEHEAWIKSNKPDIFIYRVK